MMQAMDSEHRNRVVILGSGRVGKTSILRRFLFDTYSPDYKETVEDLFSKKFHVSGTNVEADFLDTAGNLAFPAMRKLSISTAHAFILVYSITDLETFEEVKCLWEQIKEERSNYQELPIVIVGNYLDLENVRQIEKFDALNWIYSVGFSGGFVETSAKNNEGIKEVFRMLWEQARFPGVRLIDRVGPKRERTNSLEGTDSLFTEPEPDLSLIEEKKFSRSRSLIRRSSKPKLKKSSHGQAKNDCCIS